jgi:hypothetical protein
VLGPAWTGRGRPPAGYFTKRLAEDWLRDKLDELRFAASYAPDPSADGPPGFAPAPQPERTGATFADAAAEYLRYSEQDRGCKPSTLRNYRDAIKTHLLPVFGDMALEEITVREIERWRSGMSSARQRRELSNKTKNNLLVLMHAILRRAVKLYGLASNLWRTWTAFVSAAAVISKSSRPRRFGPWFVRRPPTRTPPSS